MEQNINIQTIQNKQIIKETGFDQLKDQKVFKNVHACSSTGCASGTCKHMEKAIAEKVLYNRMSSIIKSFNAIENGKILGL